MTRTLVLCFLALIAGCLSYDSPTERVGGTQYNMPLSVIAPLRLPSLADTIRSSGTGTAPRIVDSILATARFLKPLSGNARYQLYLVSALDGSARPALATVIESRVDTNRATGAVTTTRTTLPGRSSFYKGAPFNTVTSFRIGSGGVADTAIQNGAFFVVTIQADSAAAKYDSLTPKPLWFQFRNQSGTPTLTDDVVTPFPAASFGFFDAPGRSRVYSAQGRGRGAFWDRTGDGRLVYSALAEAITLPPPGYYYQPYVRDSTGKGIAFGSLVDAATGRSLFDADTTRVTGFVAQLPNALFGVREDSLGQTFTFSDYNTIQLSLEPKRADLSFPSGMAVLQGNISPLTLRARRGVLNVLVRGGTGASGVAVTVCRTGTTTQLTTGLTDAAGRVVLRSPVGMVDVRIAQACTESGTPARGGLFVRVGSEQTLELDR
ncbi:MAG: hypothetical protein WKG32_08480 [Gemmatimonadaceae bacterium]